MAEGPGNHAPGYGLGVVLVLLAAACWSLGGMFVRITEGIDAWQIIFFRSWAVVAVLTAYMAIRHGSGIGRLVRSAGLAGVAAGIACALAGLSFVSALFFTTVAQTIFMVGITPFCAALLGWWLLRERVRWPTWIAMAVAFAGLGIMLAGSPGGGAVVGSLLALFSAFCFACFSVLLRWGHQADMTPAVVWNGAFLILLAGAALLMPGPLRAAHGSEALLIGWWNLAVCMLMGAVQLGLGLILFTVGSRSVPAAELTLLALIEPVLSPLWAWLAVGEIPARPTLVGGAVIVAAIAVQAIAGAHRSLALRSQPVKSSSGQHGLA